MYSVTVRDHIMISHSLPDDLFGPAQNMHGATYVVDAVFMSETINEKNVVIDIGKASSILGSVLRTLNYKNLDELHQFKGDFTTTEFIARYIHQEVKKELDTRIKLKITLHESHIASASYEDR